MCKSPQFKRTRVIRTKHYLHEFLPITWHRAWPARRRSRLVPGPSCGLAVRNIIVDNTKERGKDENREKVYM